jgi:transposase
VCGYFLRWEARGVTERILDELRELVRLERGYDAGKRVNGRKRFIVTDTLGLLITVSVVAASVQDRDGAKFALLSAYLATPIRFVFADGAFAGRLVDWARPCTSSPNPRDRRGSSSSHRWPVERTFAWLTAHRRLARDYERSPTTSEAIIRWAAINQMIRRLTRGHPAQRQQRWRWPDTLARH